MAWLLWGYFADFTGLSLYRTASSFYTLRMLLIYFVTLFMSFKIIVAYDLEKELLQLTLLGLAIPLVSAYIANFDNFAFLGHLGSIFSKDGRYRYGFGLQHVNQVGMLIYFFLSFFTMYHFLIMEKDPENLKKDKFHLIFLFMIIPIAVMMLLSTASRGSITSLMMLWLVYFFLGFMGKTKTYTRIMFYIIAIFAALNIILSVNWEYVIYSSGRALNYTSLRVMLDKRAWLTGLGFISGGDLFNVIKLPYLDNYYLNVYLNSGLIGFTLFMTTIIAFTHAYFQNVRGMTKLQRIKGGFLASFLYLAIFETVMFGGGHNTNLLAWLVILIEMNKRDSSPKLAHRLSYSSKALIRPAERIM